MTDRFVAFVLTSALAPVDPMLGSWLTDRIDGVIRIATVGGLCGTAVAAHRVGRGNEGDPFVTVARWSTAGLVFGMFIELLTLTA